MVAPSLEPGRRSLLRPLLTAALLALGLAGAFYLRVHFRHPVVFSEEVRFQGKDAWYHARLVDHLVTSFPEPLRFDPWARFPGGQRVLTPPLFDLLVAATALAVGGGAPSSLQTDAVAAYVPPLLGTLTLLPVYFLGRRLFGRIAGLLGAGVLAVLPGQFLERSALGVADHHVAETLLTTTAMLCLVEGLARWREGPAPGRRGLGTPSWAWAVLAGFFLALYFLTWSGASLFAALVTAWASLQVVVAHLRGRSDGGASLVLPALAVPLMVVALVHEWLYRSRVSLLALTGGLLVVGVMLMLSRGLERWEVARGWIVPVAVTSAVAAAALGWWLFPSAVAGVLGEVRRLSGTTATATVGEGVALLFPGGRFTPVLAWLQFASGSFLAPLAFGHLAWRTAREPRPERLLFLVWTVVVVAATLGQNRFGYYAAVNVALLTGFAAATVLGWGGVGTPATPRQRLTYGTLAGVAVALLVFVPCLRLAVPAMARDRGPSAGWMAALHWLRSHTPEPFPEPDAYLRSWEWPGPGGFDYPPSAYGVLSWWDYGYWILRQGRRIPNANPTQAGAVDVARFLLAGSEAEGVPLVRALGSRYVVVDRLLVYQPAPGGTLAGKLRSLAVWAGRAESDFVATYLRRGEDGGVRRVVLFRPAYYRTMVARLYLFRGRAHRPREATWLVASRPGPEGTRWIEEMRRFASWEEARDHLASHPEREYEVMGRSPTESCVPLEALASFRQVYPEGEEEGGPVLAEEVRIFEVTERPLLRPSRP